MQAQDSVKKIAGEYDLEGVMEVGSGILLKEDHTFQFFFSYGSLDKSGSGSWAVKDSFIILNSGERPANDFKLITSKKAGGKGITVKISDPNKNILYYTSGVLMKSGAVEEGQADVDGVMNFKMSSADTLGLYHQLFSDRGSFYDISKGSDNYFEFTIEPWIMNIYCENLVLIIHDGYLEGKHPLLDADKQYTFRKVE